MQLIGVTGLLKGWPATIGLSFLQRGLERRWRAIAALASTLLVAPLVAAVLWGAGGVRGFVENVLGARDQPIINDSVWGAAQLLFSRSGLARPFLVSGTLRDVAAAALAVWVVGLGVAALRTTGDPALCTFHVTFCVLLLLPVAHRQYAIYVLPILWIWGARLVDGATERSTAAAVSAVLILWWASENYPWPYGGSPATDPALHYCVPVAADLIALTVSVLAQRRVHGRSARAAALAHSD